MREGALDRAPRWVTTASRLIQVLPLARYRAMNLVGGRRSTPFWMSTPADLGGLEFRCDLRDPLMREVCFTGRCEPQETLLIRELLTPGMTFVDVGANWGYFTLFGAHLVGSTGRVISVEADPRAWHVLHANVERNLLSQVSLHAVAASDGSGTLSMFTYGHANDDSSNFGVTIADTAGPSPTGPCFDIPARSLDDLLDETGVERVDLLKMDIEGGEGRALKGLDRHLSKGLIDRILLELHPQYLQQQGETAEGVIALLRKHSRHMWHIDHTADAYRVTARSRHVTASSLLTSMDRVDSLGSWPHLLWQRENLDSRVS